MTTGVGMIGAGVIGAVILGFVQDKTIDRKLEVFDHQHNTSLHSTYVTEEKNSIFGDYRSLDITKLSHASKEEKEAVTNVENDAKKSALKTVALFPIGMMICYILLMIYFKRIGGYRIVLLGEREK